MYAYIFVCLNQSFLSPGTLGTFALVDSIALKRKVTVLASTVWVGAANVQRLPYPVRFVSNDSSNMKTLIENTLQEVIAEGYRPVLHLFGVRAGSLIPHIKNTCPNALIGIDIRAPQLNDPLEAAVQRMAIFDSAAFVNQFFFCTASLVDRYYSGLREYSQVSELPFGMDSELIRAAALVERTHQTEITSEHPRIIAYAGAFTQKRDVNKWIDLLPETIFGSTGSVLQVYAEIDVEIATQLTATKKYLRFMGLLDRPDLFASLSQSEIGLALVPFTEPYEHMPSLKMMEYLALGLKVVATKTSGHIKQATDYGAVDDIFWVECPVFSDLAFAISQALGTNRLNPDHKFNIPNYTDIAENVIERYEQYY